MNKTKIRIGTRGSKLALYQANLVKDTLENTLENIDAELVIIKTKGDKILDVALSKIGDKGLFTKELEVALFNDEIDVAVHSLKDLPTAFPEGAKLGGVLKRAEVSDAFVSKDGRSLNQFTSEDTIATSSLRRQAQLLAINPEFKIVDIRGNVGTRLQKMHDGHCDAMVMAAAGLQRLGLDEHITHLLDPKEYIPAVSQGAIGIEIRENDSEVETVINHISDKETEMVTKGERKFLRSMEGGCQIPIGCYTIVDGDQIKMTGLVASINGQTILKSTHSGSIIESEAVAMKIHDELIEKGAKEILDEIRNSLDQVDI